jgi:transcriptional regulator NrdR family protein
MICPNCKGSKTKVRDTRESKDGRRRRYLCACQHRFTTLEVLVERDSGQALNGQSLRASLMAQLRADAERGVKERIRALLEL